MGLVDAIGRTTGIFLSLIFETSNIVISAATHYYKFIFAVDEVNSRFCDGLN